MAARWLLLAVAISVPRVTLAQAEDDQAAAREAFERGIAMFDAGDVSGALSQFRESYGLHPTAVASFNIAASLEKLGDPQGALEVFRGYLAEFGSAARPADVADVRRRITALVEAIAAQPPVPVPPVAPPPGTPPTLTSQLDSSPDDELPSEYAEERTPEAAPPVTEIVPAMGSVQIVSPIPDARIRVDGIEVGSGTATGTLEAGTHDLEVSAVGFETYTREFEIVVGQIQTVQVDLLPLPAAPAADEESWYEKWWVWTIIGVVVAGATTTGVVLGMGGDPDRIPAADWSLSAP
jgi:hypothetical protein